MTTPRLPARTARARARRRGTAALVLAATALATAAAGCGGTSTGNTPSGTISPPDPATSAVPGSTPGSAPRTAPVRSSATIDAFDLPSSITCVGAADVEVGATYRTSGATVVAFVVDGSQAAGRPPLSGSFPVPLRCDGNAHTVVLSAVDDQGRAAVSSKVVLTGTDPAGD